MWIATTNPILLSQIQAPSTLVSSYTVKTDPWTKLYLFTDISLVDWEWYSYALIYSNDAPFYWINIINFSRIILTGQGRSESAVIISFALAKTIFKWLIYLNSKIERKMDRDGFVRHAWWKVHQSAFSDFTVFDCILNQFSFFWSRSIWRLQVSGGLDQLS